MKAVEKGKEEYSVRFSITSDEKVKINLILQRFGLKKYQLFKILFEQLANDDKHLLEFLKQYCIEHGLMPKRSQRLLKKEEERAEWMEELFAEGADDIFEIIIGD